MEYTVVIAEDEELLLFNTIKKVENVPGFKVVGRAQTGMQALSEIKDKLPDILITDIRMPVMDGMELLTRARDAGPDISMIIMSGFSDFEYTREALHLKVYDYLLKPVTQNVITEVFTKLKTDLDLIYHNYIDNFGKMNTNASPKENAHLIHSYIINHFTEPLNLCLLAKTMSYSPSYLSKVFTNEYEISPIKFLIQIRLQKACHYLIHNPDLTVLQVSQMTGFDDPGYFSRTFKKHIGVSPKDFKKNAQNDSLSFIS